MVGSIPEVQQLTDTLYNCSSAYGIEVSLEKSKIMYMNSQTAIHTL